ncbi:MAG TPA: IclR family transcriptional regulator [Anaerolineae bacterium]|nr:IclR family transcriptional regulator [Anaerolineae bacterium]HPL27427.1 IclR family transcriptional regulator [Anaerolineae bacterium]
MKDTTVYNVRVIERAMHILACFDDEHPERGISEIAQLAGLPASTVLRILVTLQQAGYVERGVGGEKFRLGPRLMEMGLGILRRLRVRREAKPFMVALERRFEETCDLSVFIGSELLCIDVMQSRHALRIATTPGYRSPLHCTASGKVFLAYLSPEQVASVVGAALQRYTEKTITAPERLAAQLAEIRACGYGIDDEEFRPGVRAVAAPIRDSDGTVVAVIGVPGPVERMGGERTQEIAAVLVEATGDISRRLNEPAEGHACSVA